MIANGLLDEIEVEFGERVKVAGRLWERPAAVRVEPEPGRCTERFPHGRDQFDVLVVVETDLEIADLEARGEAVGGLLREALARAAREVIEVRRVRPLQPTEQAPERFAAGAPADVPERHVDAGPGEVARAGAELPEAVGERVAAHRLPVPWIAPEHERRHRL